MKKKQLLILSILEPETAFLLRNMKSIFQDEIEFITCTQADLEMGRIPDPQAVLVSLDEDMLLAQTYFSDRKIIMVDRMLASSNIESIMALPEGKELIVVNAPKNCAIETVNSLYAMGVNHLKLIPYWPGCGMTLAGYDTAIYLGFKEYVPREFEKCIDIGYRHISFITIFEISHEFGLSYQHIRNVYEGNISLLVKKNYDLKRLLSQTKTTEQSFRWICDMSQDGVICIDSEDKIAICNPVAESLLSKEALHFTHADYRNVFSDCRELLALVANRKETSDLILTLGGQKVVVNTYKIDIGNANNYLINIALVETIQKTEIQIRKKLSQKGFLAKYHFQDIGGESEAIRDVMTLAKRYAKSDLSVLITGESGTGKELFAQAIHNASDRANAPFVAINFAALPETLAESELFGYEEGAFTGALKGGKPGLFELAHNGTLFLDEIGDASLSVQARLLRVLEEREVMRIGSSKYIPINVRIICATNKNLPRLVRDERFRGDLLFRVDVLPLPIPALKERRADIIPVMNRISLTLGIDRHFSPEVLELFRSYDWPGNVRELKAAIQYLSVIGKDEQLCGDAELQKFAFAYFRAKKNSRAGERHNDRSKESIQFFLLTEIRKANASGLRIGRNTFLKYAKEQNIALTEAMLKMHLSQMKESGLILQGATKQGTRVTPAGEQYVKEKGTIGEIGDDLGLIRI